MSEENAPEAKNTTDENVAETEVVETKKTLEKLTQEELVDYVRELRKENASHRTAKQAKDKELEEFRAWKESQKTDLQKAQEAAESLKSENLSLLRMNAALASGLDPEMAEFVKGDTPDEIKASAQKLAGKTVVEKPKPGSYDIFSGVRGTAVDESPKDTKQLANNYLKQLIWGNGQ